MNPTLQVSKHGLRPKHVRCARRSHTVCRSVKSILHEQPGIAPQTNSRWPNVPVAVPLPTVRLGRHRCPYLPGREASDEAFLADKLPPGLYHELMNSSFRRSGKVLYRPMCAACRACRPVRVRAEDFRPSKSLRRCLRRNADLDVSFGPLDATDEKFDLYRRYQRTRHGERDHLDWHSFVDFLYDSPVRTLEFSYRHEGTAELLAVGICDASRRSLSSVYFYFDPDHLRRGLGTLGVLREIEWCRANDVPHYYLGFWVEGCAAMAYKLNFRPSQILGTDGVWRDVLPEFAPAGEAASA